MKRILMNTDLSELFFFKEIYLIVQNWRHLKHSSQTQGCRMIIKLVIITVRYTSVKLSV